MSDFSETMKRIRHDKRMTQEEFAAFLGTSKQNVSRYENGDVSPKISTAARIAEKLGISLAELNGSQSETDGPITAEELQRARITTLFLSLTEENQNRLIDYAQLLLTAQQAGRGSRE